MLYASLCWHLAWRGLVGWLLQRCGCVRRLAREWWWSRLPEQISQSEGCLLSVLARAFSAALQHAMLGEGACVGYLLWYAETW